MNDQAVYFLDCMFIFMLLFIENFATSFDGLNTCG